MKKNNEKVASNKEESEVKSEIGVKGLNSEQSERLDKSLSACQIIKNVVKTCMEMRNKLKNSVIRKLARKIVKKKKRTVCKKQRKVVRKNGAKRIVIDLNININLKN